jgi:hypothetical protein
MNEETIITQQRPSISIMDRLVIGPSGTLMTYGEYLDLDKER